MKEHQTEGRMPPMRPSDEAKEEQLRMAKEQGDALKKALDHMVTREAEDGGEKHAGDYMVGYAVEKAEGMYMRQGDRMQWKEPAPDENVHVEVSVRDAADGRFIPGLTVHATLMDSQGKEVGTHRQQFIWHPWLYHYGRNWHVPGDGHYTLRVRIEPPDFPRHDKINGERYERPVEVEFQEVRIKTGQKK